jgi:hypothetical protein
MSRIHSGKRPFQPGWPFLTRELGKHLPMVADGLGADHRHARQRDGFPELNSYPDRLDLPDIRFSR